jgi:hypothetical protein
MKLSSAHKAQLAKIGRVTLAGAMVVGSVAGTAPVSSVSAGALTSISVALSDSRPNTTATHTVSFKLPSGSTTAINQVDVKWCNTAGTFEDACTAPAGFNLITTSASAAGFKANSGATTGTFSVSGNVASFVVTTPAAEDPTMAHTLVFPGLTNGSSTGTKYLRVRTYSDLGSAALDTGGATYAIINPVTVSGQVLENLTFTVAPENGLVACGTGATVTAPSADATAIPFGVLTAGTSKVACQHITTATNAAAGYSVSLRHVNGGTAPQGGMCRQTAANCGTSGASTNTITATDVIADNGLTGTPAAWSEGTTKGQGVNVNGTNAQGFNAGGTDYKSLMGALGLTIAAHTAPTNGDTQNVVFRVDIPAAQTAGVYQNQVEYNVTPTY